MKLWKKAAAAVLAAVMALTLLTGCSGGGGGGSAYPPVTPDTVREKQMIGYVQDYAKDNYGVELVEADDNIRDAVYAVLPEAVVYIDDSLEGKNTARQLEQLMSHFDNKITAQNKKGFGAVQAFKGILVEREVDSWLDRGVGDYIEELKRRGIEPKAVSVAATTKFNGNAASDVVYILLAITD